MLGQPGWFCLHPRRNARFPETVICDQCNVADGYAKKRLALPSVFSFSPAEISLFVKAEPHRPHRVDLEKAREAARMLDPCVKKAEALMAKPQGGMEELCQ